MDVCRELLFVECHELLLPYHHFAVHHVVAQHLQLPVCVIAVDPLLDEHVDETIVFSFGYLNEIRTQLAAYEQGGGRFVSLLDLLR